MREYRIRLPKELPDVTSDVVSAWLDQALADGDALRLPADPGGGAARVSLSLDRDKVLKLANARGEKPVPLLRRLIASHVHIDVPEPKEEWEKSEAELPERVLPRKLSYDAEDFLRLIEAMDKGLAALYRRAYALKELKPAETPKEDRKLAEGMAEVANRRSPAWFVGNADLVRLAISAFSWSMAQTEQLDAQVREGKSAKAQEPPAIEIAPPVAHEAGPPAPKPGTAHAPARSPAAPGAELLSPVQMEHIMEPVQLEGEF